LIAFLCQFNTFMPVRSYVRAEANAVLRKCDDRLTAKCAFGAPTVEMPFGEAPTHVLLALPNPKVAPIRRVFGRIASPIWRFTRRDSRLWRD